MVYQPKKKIILPFLPKPNLEIKTLFLVLKKVKIVAVTRPGSVSGSMFAAEDDAEQCLILQVQDVSERHQAEAQLQTLADRDLVLAVQRAAQLVGERADAGAGAPWRTTRCRACGSVTG